MKEQNFTPFYLYEFYFSFFLMFFTFHSMCDHLHFKVKELKTKNTSKMTIMKKKKI